MKGKDMERRGASLPILFEAGNLGLMTFEWKR
jgi:hypothetical protein